MPRKQKPIDKEAFRTRISLIQMERRLQDKDLELKALARKLEESNARILEVQSIDPLTGLKSKLGFEEVVKHHLAMLEREIRGGDGRKSSNHFSLIFVDLDGFKPINDRLGHLVGDNLLKQFSDFLRAITRSGDVVSRFGGDEFVILALNTFRKQASALSSKIEKSLSTYCFLSEIDPVILGASIGTASTSEGMNTYSELTSLADKRMLVNKVLKKNR